MNLSVSFRQNVLPLLLLMSSGLVSAQEVTEFPSTSGNAYLRQCSVVEKEFKDQTHEDSKYYIPCIAYTEGVVQGALMESALESAGKGTPAPFCLSSEVENGQLIRVTLKHIRKNPEQSHLPTVAIILNAMKEAFPCVIHTGKK